MKRNLLPIIVLLCILSLTTTAQVPNAGFENWTAGDPDGWTTSNAFPISLVNVTQSTDFHTGSFALRGDVVNFGGAPIGPVVQSGPGGTGFAISERYLSFECYYKFAPLGGDRFAVNVNLTKGGVPIAVGAVALPASVSTYTHLIVPINYTTSDVPDLAIIQLSINGPTTGIDLHVGSQMLVDDLSLTMVSGIGNLPEGELSGKCYPNPASGPMTISLNENPGGDGLLKICDVHGKEVKTVTNPTYQEHGCLFRLSVEDLPAGLYFYFLSGRDNHCCGKFMVSR